MRYISILRKKVIVHDLFRHQHFLVSFFALSGTTHDRQVHPPLVWGDSCSLVDTIAVFPGNSSGWVRLCVLVDVTITAATEHYSSGCTRHFASHSGFCRFFLAFANYSGYWLATTAIVNADRRYFQDPVDISRSALLFA